MPRSPRPPVVVAVCRGSSCRKDHPDAHRRLVDALDERPDVEVVPTPCLDVCKGPVAVVDVDGEEPVVVARIRRGRDRRAVVALATRSVRASESGASVVTRRKRATKAARRAQRGLARLRRRSGGVA